MNKFLIGAALVGLSLVSCKNLSKNTVEAGSSPEAAVSSSYEGKKAECSSKTAKATKAECSSKKAMATKAECSSKAAKAECSSKNAKASKAECSSTPK